MTDGRNVIPSIREHNRSFRNVICFVNIIFSGTVRNTWSDQSIAELSNGLRGYQRGTYRMGRLVAIWMKNMKFNCGDFYLWEEATDLITSLTSADKYGKSGISPKSGSLPLTTRSSSSCAFIWTSGKQIIARTKVWITEVVVSAPAVWHWWI